jgi:ABC-2 type transport system permease protein
VIANGDEVIIGEGADRQLGSLTAAALGAATFQDRAADLGLTEADIADLLGAGVALTSLGPEDPEETDNRTMALFGTILLFISIVSYGQWILIGVIEEKSNRVVEVVLGAVRPARLLAGKIIGIGLLGLLQLVVIAIVAVVTILQVGSFEIPSATASVIVSVVVWFVLGFLFYAAAYAAAGSLVTRQEEAQNAAFPLTMLMMIAYFIATFSVTGDNPVLRIASLLPPFAPMTMPMRMANGDAAVWEMALSFTLMVAAVALLIRLAGRIYSGGILRTGGKVKLREAWRSAEA